MECREIVVITTLPKLIIKNKVRVMWSSCVHRTPNIDRLSCKDQYKTPIKTYETGNPYWYISSAADVQFMIQNQGMIISSKLVNYTVMCYTVNLKPDFFASCQYWFDWTLAIYRIPHTKFHLRQHAWRLISHDFLQSIRKFSSRFFGSDRLPFTHIWGQ